MSKIVSANRLTDGIVVYRTGVGGWTPQIAAAAFLAAPDAASALDSARKDEAANLVVDAGLVDAEPTSAGPRAATLRERIRAAGPTIDYRRSAAGGR